MQDWKKRVVIVYIYLNVYNHNSVTLVFSSFTVTASFSNSTHHPDTKMRERGHKERKLQVNITDEHRCKNPQQTTSKQNPTAH